MLFRSRYVFFLCDGEGEADALEDSPSTQRQTSRTARTRSSRRRSRNVRSLPLCLIKFADSMDFSGRLQALSRAYQEARGSLPRLWSHRALALLRMGPSAVRVRRSHRGCPIPTNPERTVFAPNLSTTPTPTYRPPHAARSPSAVHPPRLPLRGPAATFPTSSNPVPDLPKAHSTATRRTRSRRPSRRVAARSACCSIAARARRSSGGRATRGRFPSPPRLKRGGKRTASCSEPLRHLYYSMDLHHTRCCTTIGIWTLTHRAYVAPLSLTLPVHNLSM